MKKVSTGTRVIIKVLGHQYWWLADVYDLEIRHHVLEVNSMVVTWWIVVVVVVFLFYFFIFYVMFLFLCVFFAQYIHIWHEQIPSV